MTTETMEMKTKGEVQWERPWSIMMTSPTRTELERPRKYSSKTETATAEWTTDRSFPPRWEPPTAPMSEVDMAVGKIDEDDTEVGE